MSPRPTASDATRLARRRWLDGQRVDMSAMAAELDVNRVTLYRWLGLEPDPAFAGQPIPELVR